MRTLHIDRHSPRRRIPNGLDKVDSLLRSRLRTTLTSVGLLSAARSVRDSVRSVQHLADNAPFWFRGTPDGLPAPPVNLVRLTTGTFSLAWMFQSGALAASSIVTALAKNGVRLESLGRVLDFGCGCGRVVRHWARLDAEVHGCDYNPRPINWCRRRLTFARFATNGLHPPLPYGSAQFDLVYALSVFTHLPEPLAFAWMREMQRVLKPDGLLLVTTHGEAYLDELTDDERRLFHQARLVVRNPEAAGTNYCGVYCSEDYIRETLSDGFNLVDFIPRGAAGNPHQDLVLLRRARH